MAVSNQNNQMSYLGDSVTLIFPYTFKIFADTDLVVQLYEIATGITTTLTLTSQYTVSGVGQDAGGNVTLGISAPTNAYRILITRELDITQETVYVENAPFPAKTTENDLDRRCMIEQQLKTLVDSCIKLSSGVTGYSPILPVPQSGYLLGWGSSGIINVANSASGASGASGFSGWSGLNGLASASGYSGFSGLSGWSGSGGGATATRLTFVNADLVIGVLTITHNKALTAPYAVLIQIFDNTGKMIMPDEVTGATNTVDVDLTSYDTITGTWEAIYIA